MNDNDYKEALFYAASIFNERLGAEFSEDNLVPVSYTHLADKSLERIVMLLARGIPSSTSNDLLSKLKVFLADNCFMRTFYDDRLIDNTLF